MIHIYVISLPQKFVLCREPVETFGISIKKVAEFAIAFANNPTKDAYIEKKGRKTKPSARETKVINSRKRYSIMRESIYFIWNTVNT